MLSKIILTNFRSFCQKTEIDFTRTNYQVLSDKNVAPNGILKGVLFVGPNASGKSNILRSIQFLLDLLFKEVEVDAGLMICLSSDKPSFTLEYQFLINNDRIIYRIEYNSHKAILDEKLYVNDELYLDRLGQTAKSYIDKIEKTYGENEVSKKTLFLRTLFFNTGFASNDTLRLWFDYLRNSVYFNAFTKTIRSYSKQNLHMLNYLQSSGPDAINRFFKQYNFQQQVELGEVITENMETKIKFPFFKRRGIKHAPHIPFTEESQGNQTLLNLLPVIFHITSNPGILLLDEFTSGFHNELEELLVRYFMEYSTTSQLIFVSHSTNLLTTALLRPDQIYSVTFIGSSGSKVKRFSEEQPRVAQNMEKMYLSGVFDGLPGYKTES